VDAAAGGEGARAGAGGEEELVFSTLYSRDLLHAALRVLAEPELDRSRVGELLDEHHARLRDALALSTPRIEALRTAALAAGALGAKVNGSGGGGSLFAYAPGCEAAVVAAARELGARARVVTASRGASVTSA
jgi:galactokinase